MTVRKKHIEVDAVEFVEKDYIGSRDDRPEDRTVSSRARVRQEVSSQIAEFLARGGSINEVEPNVMADPPRKPSTAYGSRPI